MITALPGFSAAGSPFQKSTISPSCGSSARRTTASGGRAGSSRENHPPALDDAPDMVHSEVIKDMPVIRDVEDHQVRLFADLQRTDAVRVSHGNGGVLRKPCDTFMGKHLLLRSGH